MVSAASEDFCLVLSAASEVFSFAWSAVSEASDLNCCESTLVKEEDEEFKEGGAGARLPFGTSAFSIPVSKCQHWYGEGEGVDDLLGLAAMVLEPMKAIC